MEMAAQTHIGGRARNEDAVFIDVENGLAVVADGMGGHPSGDIASRIAVDSISRLLGRRRPWEVDGPDLRQAISEAHEAILAHAEHGRSTRGMGTTVVAAYIPPTQDVLWVAHVGDSRAYLHREDGGLRALTEDHAVSVVGDGRPLTQALGGRRARPTVIAVDLRARDRILLSTDGLHDVVEERTIARLLAASTSAGGACDVLIDQALERGGPDNIGVAVITID